MSRVTKSSKIFQLRNFRLLTPPGDLKKQPKNNDHNNQTKRLTLLRDSCIQGHPPKLRDDEREEVFLRAWNFFGEGPDRERLKAGEHGSHGRL